MKLTWTKAQPLEPLTRPADRRWGLAWCATCREQQNPLIYLENGKLYCSACATKVNAIMRIRSAGRRATDIQFP
jgi:hypothetical protein